MAIKKRRREGELIACRITHGNIVDRKPVLSMTEGLKGKLFGGKGYISQTLYEKLRASNVELIAGSKKNIKKILMALFDKLMPRKRSLKASRTSSSMLLKLNIPGIEICDMA